MPRFLSRFRVRLTLVLLAAGLVPLLAVGLPGLHLARGAIENLVHQKHRAVLDAVTAGIARTVAGRMAQLEALARHPAVQSLDPRRAQVLLLDFAAQDGFFNAVRLYDREGNERTLLTAREGFAGVPAATVAEALAEGRAGQTALRAAGAGGTLFAAVPVRSFDDPAVVTGVLAARAVLTGARIHEVLGAFPVREGEYIALLDAEGEIVARKGALAATARRIELPPRSGSEATALAVDNAGRLDLVSLEPSPFGGGWIVIGQEAGAALAAIGTLETNLLAVGILSVGLCAGLSFYLARATSRPIGLVTVALERLRDGVLSHRIPDPGDDELGEAARAYNALADRLERKVLIASLWEQVPAADPATDELESGAGIAGASEASEGPGRSPGSKRLRPPGEGTSSPAIPGSDEPGNPDS